MRGRGDPDGGCDAQVRATGPKTANGVELEEGGVLRHLTAALVRRCDARENAHAMLQLQERIRLRPAGRRAFPWLIGVHALFLAHGALVDVLQGTRKHESRGKRRQNRTIARGGRWREKLQTAVEPSVGIDAAVRVDHAQTLIQNEEGLNLPRKLCERSLPLRLKIIQRNVRLDPGVYRSDRLSGHGHFPYHGTTHCICSSINVTRVRLLSWADAAIAIDIKPCDAILEVTIVRHNIRGPVWRSPVVEGGGRAWRRWAWWGRHRGRRRVQR